MCVCVCQIGLELEKNSVANQNQCHIFHSICMQVIHSDTDLWLHDYWLLSSAIRYHDDDDDDDDDSDDGDKKKPNKQNKWHAT